MSDSYLIIIPTDPLWQADADAAEKAGRVIAGLTPAAEDIEAFSLDEVEFFDAGENFESAKCPHCGTDVTEWWPDAMDRAHELSFGDLSTTMPCCGRPASLNDLVYDKPQGFARFAISVTEPGLEELDGEASRKIGEALGHPIRVIWQRI